MIEIVLFNTRMDLERMNDQMWFTDAWSFPHNNNKKNRTENENWHFMPIGFHPNIFVMQSKGFSFFNICS